MEQHLRQARDAQMLERKSGRKSSRNSDRKSNHKSDRKLDRQTSRKQLLSSAKQPHTPVAAIPA
jgi:hypothetical protein